MPAPAVTCAVPAPAVTYVATPTERASPVTRPFNPHEISHEQPAPVFDETPVTDGGQPVKYAQLPAPLTSAVPAVVFAAVALAVTTFTRC